MSDRRNTLKTGTFPTTELVALADQQPIEICKRDPKQLDKLRRTLVHMMAENPDADHSKWQIARIVNAFAD
ncbi:hypothetical protein [Sandaracinus amylolyticus]|uniref:hypothetical protein n=1 Tax=Sandaracinus amylolyticus TaxID=927083 RepID=UPI001F29B28C|nr:hypothetical protein [Sandaracinus amylolyticus]UJR78912.1 Hypothetical protein I5071_9450 [Sandaracinus amylolyticus]